MQFATPQNTKQPKVKALIHHNPVEGKDHILGGFGPSWEIVLPKGNWLEFAWDNPEIQVVLDGDTYWCVTYSHNSAWRFVWKAQYKEDFNVSERLLAIGSGTKLGQGNSKYAVAEWARKNGFVMQADCPTPNTIRECYSSLDKAVLAKGQENLKTVEIAYKYLKNNAIETIIEGLQYSPVQVDVQSYSYNDKGYIDNNGGSYIHEVILVGDMGDFWAVWDSENSQWLKYDKSYKFGYPMIHSLKKKTMGKYYKAKNSPAIYALDLETATLVPFSDGYVQGGKFLKTVFGVTNYSDLPRVKNSKGEDWDVLPFPVADWKLTSEKI